MACRPTGKPSMKRPVGMAVAAVGNETLTAVYQARTGKLSAARFAAN
jgi:hypothetical protein